MKLAIMQPYFFPYIGYWQLIHASDSFVLFDDAQYIRHGWINRNRILKPDGGWQYIVVPLKSHSFKDQIKNIQAHPHSTWKERILRQLEHYKKKAPFFDETTDVIKEILSGTTAQKIGDINLSIIGKLSSKLGMSTEIFLSSSKAFDYSDVRDAGEWALRIAEQMGAHEYINPGSGAGLFCRKKFASSGIKLRFLKSENVVYSQQSTIEPSLSIIDMMMFNGISGTKRQLDKYSVESW